MIARNNIFNIRSTSTTWLGKTGSHKGFVEFDTQEHGIRAWLVLMRTYRRRGLKTIRQIVSTYAPPSENETERYIQNCSRMVVRHADAPLQHDIEYDMLGVAMARMETGTRLDISEVRSVMKKYNIHIV